MDDIIYISILVFCTYGIIPLSMSGKQHLFGSSSVGQHSFLTSQLQGTSHILIII